MSAWSQVEVSAPPLGGVQSAVVVRLQSMQLTTAWGARPAEAALTYVSSEGAYAPVTINAWLKLTTSYGHLFYGLAKSDAPARGSGGSRRVIQFVDLRDLLEWDQVFGAFNQVDKRVVGGVVKRRWWHVWPADAAEYRRSYTDQPVSAATIVRALLTAPTVRVGWWAELHRDQELWPVMNLDWMSGRSLGQALLELTERQGLVFGLVSTEAQPYRLVWARKGFGTVTVPAHADDVREGIARSPHPEQVCVVGDRNLYQVLNVSLRADWNTVWQELWTVELLADWLYDHGTLPVAVENIPAGTHYNAIAGDTEHYQGRHLAMARALTITVGEYAALRNDRDFHDYRLYAGRVRDDIPAAVYVSTILFRAFRPASVTIAGRTRDLSSLRLVGEQVAAVTYNPAATVNPLERSGVAWTPAQGNGVVVAKGYQVGKDLFAMIRPERFDVSAWVASQQLWHPVGLQIDESGEDGGYVLCEEAVIRSEDLVTMVDGKAVFVAQPTFRTPDVAACLSFEAERFTVVRGVASGRMVVENVSGLRGEYVVVDGVPTELAYDDGQTATQKANLIAAVILEGRQVYAQGGYRRALVEGDTPTALSPVIDRVTVTLSPQGFTEEVDFTTERTWAAFVPEREFDRRLRERSLVPGEAELRQQGQLLQLVASGLRHGPRQRQMLSEVFQGRLGCTEPLYAAEVESGSGTLPVGTPLWRDGVKARAVMPSASTADHQVFAGVTCREGEAAAHPLKVQLTGEALVRVHGPVAVGERVAQAPGNDYLLGVTEAADEAVEVGTAQEAVADGETKLVNVLLGGGGGTVIEGGGDARWA